MSDDLRGRTAELTADLSTPGGGAHTARRQPGAPDATRRHENRTLLVAASGTFLALALFTTPFGSLAEVAAVLGAGAGGQTWMLSSMSVGLTSGLLITGALADDFGRRRMFVAGTAVIAAACVLGVLVASAPLFILGRVGQGLGAAAVVSCSLGLIGHTFPSGAKRVRASGLWGAAVGAGIAFGPVLAALANAELGWRWPYLLLAVLAGGVALAARLLLPESVSGSPRRVDLPGALLLGSGTVALLAGLVTGRGGWTRPATVVLLGTGLVVLGAFVLVELRTERRDRDPLLALGLLRRPDFAAVTVAGVATGLGVIAAMSYAPIVLERGLHTSTLTGALAIVIWSGVSVPVALAARRLKIDGDAQLAAGLLLVTVGLSLLTALHVGDGPGRLVPGLVVAGIGSGVLNAALGRQAVASVPPERAGMGSGVNNTARYLGSAIGVTIVSVIATHAEPAALIAGWNAAVLVTAAFSALGAGVVLLLRARRP
ncbi:MAG TPA: MFS transporter [Pseudonocardia sp.]|nr:MFS transporter [Pseudonocardia sp.]